jgi:hypothetical protein
MLAIVITISGIRGSLGNAALLANGLPQFTVIKLASIGLPSSVINILYVNKNGGFIHKTA